MTTKSEITKAFNVLRKFGYLVANFSHNRAVSKGNAGFPDINIIGHGYIIYVETKIDRDNFSPDQAKYKEAILDCMGYNTRLYYFTATENNYKEIVDTILTRNF